MKKKMIWVVIAVLILGIVIFLASPQLRVKAFVSMYSDKIEAGLQNGSGVPGHLGEYSFNTWEGEHDMLEFVLITRGDTYYGCYYSYDNVPLAFQNTEAELTQNGHDYWEWSDSKEITIYLGNYNYCYSINFNFDKDGNLIEIC